MGNVFPRNRDDHETYDLKGFTLGRVTIEEEIQRNPHAVLKDLNWVERNRRLEFGSIKRKLSISQLHKDVMLLSRLNIMDYSLLIGIHDNVRGNTEGIRDTHLHFVTAHTKSLERSLSTRNGRRESRADIKHRLTRKNIVFYSEEDGFKSTDDNNQTTDKLYFLGVINILTPYNYIKKSEHFIKSFTQNKNTISAINPELYGQRFIHFIENAVTSNTKKLD